MPKLGEEHIAYLEDSLKNIEYGSILITVHDGYITQIDTTEKKRFTKVAKTNPKVRTLKTK